MQNKTRLIILACTVIVILAIITVIEQSKPDRSGGDTEVVSVAKDASFTKKMRYDQAKELAGISGYLNTGGEAIRIADLIGKKVIMVDFWTYSCINCQRTTPYLNAWYDKYRDQGLEIIGVHTPEFDFEKNKENVAQAIAKFGIAYPVVQDNDYATWRAYANRYWPRKYLIDIDGYIVYDHIGEGGYEETEKKIQELLRERAETLATEADISSDVADPDVDIASSQRPGSPEIYFGAWRNEHFGNGKQSTEGVQTLTRPEKISLNQLYLVGEWNITREYAESVSDDARVIFKFRAQDVFTVASADPEKEIQVLLDGVPVTVGAGMDVVNGKTTISDETLYRLIEADQSSEHTLEMIVPAGVQYYTFTFG